MSESAMRFLNDYFTFYCQTKNSTGPVNADFLPTYRVYEEETDTPILTGAMALRDAVNTDGYYSEQIQLLAASGFEENKDYDVRIFTAVGGVSGTTERSFRIYPALMRDTDVNNIVTGTIDTNADINTILADVQAIVAKLPTNYIMGSTDQNAHDTDIDTLVSRVLGTISAGTHYPQSGDAYAIVASGTIGNNALNNKLNTIAGYIDTEISTIITHLTDIKGAGWTTQTLQAILTAINSKPSVSEINATVDTAISDAGLATQISVNTIDGVIDSIFVMASHLDTLLELDGEIYRFTFNALEQAPTGSGGFTSDDRNNLQANAAISAIIATMYENSSGYRWKAKALEAAPVTSISGLATSVELAAVDDKIDIIYTNIDTINTRTSTIDTKVDTLDQNVDAILEDTSSTGVKVESVETGLTFAHAIQILVALACKMDGGGTTTIHARNYADNKNRITWVVDANGNRTGITFNFD